MDDLVRNEALRISIEWGPRRSIPYETRLANSRPELAQSQIEELRTLCAQVESEAWGTVVQHFKANGMNDAAAIDAWTTALRAKWPWLNQNNLASLWTQGCYYAWKEGDLT